MKKFKLIHRHMQQVSLLASKLTMLTGKEIYLNFNHMPYMKNGVKHWMPVVYCDKYHVSVGDVEWLETDIRLNNIYVNKIDSTIFETIFLIGTVKDIIEYHKYAEYIQHPAIKLYK